MMESCKSYRMPELIGLDETLFVKAKVVREGAASVERGPLQNG
jgi:hypothetical protein